jgi:hypothetical protein
MLGTLERYATFRYYLGRQLRVPHLIVADADIGIYCLG